MLSLIVVLFFSLSSQAAKEFKFSSLSDMKKCTFEYRYDTGVCLAPLENYIKHHTSDALAAAELSRKEFQHWVALRFFEIASKKHSEKIICSNNDFSLAVISALSLPEEEVETKRAAKMLTVGCFKYVKVSLEKQLSYIGASGYFRDNTCQIFKKHKQNHEACEPKKVTKVDVEKKRKVNLMDHVDKSKLKLSELIKVYKGPESEKLTIAPLEGGELVLVKIEGIPGPWNKKVFLHKAESSSFGSTRFWTEYQGEKWITVIKQANSGYNSYQVFAPEVGGNFYVSYSEDDSKKASAKKLLAELK